jgi:hypothetical protein
MILPHEILMGRDSQAPLDEIQWRNLTDLIARLNALRVHYGKPMTVSSGYRPPNINSGVGGAKSSAHMSCQAVDFRDPNGELAAWCLKNMKLLVQLGLYLEDPAFTKGWVHLQSRPTNNNPFKP